MAEKILQECSDSLDESVLGVLRDVGKASENLGERCYVAGGLVRDCLLGIGGKDIDLVCSDSEKVAEVIADISLAERGKRPTITKFKKFGTYQLRFRDEDLELVDPRRETYTYQSHKPETVEEGSFLDDALRRDFTLNALFLGIQNDDWMNIIDLTGKGIDDLKRGILRTPLDPDTTFIDDPSRIFRLARFKACKGFDIAPETTASARKNSAEVNVPLYDAINTRLPSGEIKTEKILTKEHRVPREFVRQEMDRGILCKGYVKTLDDLSVLEQVIPEVELMKDCEQPEEHHLYDVWTHTLKTIDNLPQVKELRWAGLFHDIGKPPNHDKCGTFHGHESESEKVSQGIMERFKFSNDDIRRISHIIKHHMDVLGLISQDDPRHKKKISDRSIRRFAVKNDGYESDLIEFAYADTKASGVHWKEDHKKIERLENRLRDLELDLGMAGGSKFKLAVTGYDIMNTLNIKPGIGIGEVQKKLTDQILDGTLKNDREELIKFMKREIE